MASNPPLSSSQQALLKTAIQGSGDTNALLVSGDLGGLLALLNTVASPDFWVWRTFVADAEIYEATTADLTTWSWSIYIARSQGERDAWRQMVNMKGGLNAALANVRQGVADIFSGAPGLAQRTHLLTIGRRLSTRFEKVFATGTGSTASPGTLLLEGPLNASAISELIGQ